MSLTLWPVLSRRVLPLVVTDQVWLDRFFNPMTVESFGLEFTNLPDETVPRVGLEAGDVGLTELRAEVEGNGPPFKLKRKASLRRRSAADHLRGEVLRASRGIP